MILVPAAVAKSIKNAAVHNKGGIVLAKVALIKCDSYGYEKVRDAVKRGLDLLGGPLLFAGLGERILLKPNLLSADPPEKASTTHFIVFKAVADILKSTGAELTYGDSPGFHTPEAAARKNRIAEAADELGIKLADFHKGEDVSYSAGIQNKKFHIAKGVLESDGIISLPKLKTHGFARMTGSIKNQFGCIPGPLKGEFHVRIPNANDFAKMLVDLNMLLKPRLYIMDGIIAMEGNGPRSGTPKNMKVLLMASDPVALDAVVCRIINLNPEYVPTIKYGYEAGLGVYKEKDIELLGDNIEDFIDKEFVVTREPIKPYTPGNSIQFLRNLLVPKPYIEQDKCIRCGVCVKMCPVNPKAVDWHDGDKTKNPSYFYKNCIRCYCCQELCPESAIKLKVPFIRRIFEKK